MGKIVLMLVVLSGCGPGPATEYEDGLNPVKVGQNVILDPGWGRPRQVDAGVDAGVP